MPIRSLAAVAVMAFVVTGCTRNEDRSSASAATLGPGSAPADKSSISVKGSDTMVILGQRWAETYMKDNPGVTVQVTGGGRVPASPRSSTAPPTSASRAAR